MRKPLFKTPATADELIRFGELSDWLAKSIDRLKTIKALAQATPAAKGSEDATSV